MDVSVLKVSYWHVGYKVYIHNALKLYGGIFWGKNYFSSYSKSDFLKCVT